jgi:hypothetical protein
MADKIKAKIDKFFQDEKYYEAQQLLRTQYNRATNAKDKADIAVEGAMRLFDKKQGSAGGDLAMLAVDAFRAGNEKPSNPQLETLRKLACAFPAGSEDTQLQFLKHALKWTIEKGPNPEGAQQLQLELARLALRKKDFAAANKHFIRSQAPEEHSALLCDLFKESMPKDADVFVAKSVLQYLCVEDLKSANLLFANMKAFCKAALDSPLTNFIGFLLKTVERDATQLFQLLRGKYAISLARDASLNAYLDRIGELYFGLKAPGMLDLLNLL